MTETVHDRPAQTPEQASGAVGVDVPRPLSPADLEPASDLRVDLGSPGMEPPGSVGARATATAVGAVQADKRVSALWCNRSTRNAFMHVTGIGWKRLSPANDSSWNAMVLLATQARQTGCRIDYRDEADGLVHEIFLW
jgi:hypothetical protein